MTRATALAILVLLGLVLLLGQRLWGVQGGDAIRASEVREVQAQARVMLDTFRAQMSDAAPETVRVTAYRYIRRHDTAWMRDTVTRDSVVEAVRWLTLSDSSQRVRCDSLAGELSLVAPARASSNLTVGLLAVADADGIRPGVVVERRTGWARIGGGLVMDAGLRRPGLVGMISLDW